MRDLDIIIDVFLTPVKQKKILTGKEMTIFSSVDQLKPIHEELSKQLSIRFDTNPVVEEVGDVFVTMVRFPLAFLFLLFFLTTNADKLPMFFFFFF